MLRIFVLKSQAKNLRMVLPITPAQYSVTSEMGMNVMEMSRAADISIPGNMKLGKITIEALLPAQLYPFCNPGTVPRPDYYIEKLEKWQKRKERLHFFIKGTSVSRFVYIARLEWREEDGTCDVKATIELQELRTVQPVRTAKNTKISARTDVPRSLPYNYTCVKGDTLTALCKKVYGNQGYAPSLATYNALPSVTYMAAGLVITFPVIERLSL